MIEEKLTQLVVETFKLKESINIAETSMGITPGWSSLMHLKLIIKIEDVFNIKIPANKIQKTTSFVELLSLISDEVPQSCGILVE